MPAPPDGRLLFDLYMGTEAHLKRDLKAVTERVIRERVKF